MENIKNACISRKIPYYINVPASTIDACPAEQCVRHFLFPCHYSDEYKGAAKMPKKGVISIKKIHSLPL